MDDRAPGLRLHLDVAAGRILDGAELRAGLRAPAIHVAGMLGQPLAPSAATRSRDAPPRSLSHALERRSPSSLVQYWYLTLPGGLMTPAMWPEPASTYSTGPPNSCEPMNTDLAGAMWSSFVAQLVDRQLHLAEVELDAGDRHLPLGEPVLVRRTRADRSCGWPPASASNPGSRTAGRTGTASCPACSC